jgi:hypothetical protein
LNLVGPEGLAVVAIDPALEGATEKVEGAMEAEEEELMYLDKGAAEREDWE